jgi:hypothetical protein
MEARGICEVVVFVGAQDKIIVEDFVFGQFRFQFPFKGGDQELEGGRAALF